MRRGILFAFFLIAHSSNDFSLKPAIIEASKAFNVTPTAIDKSIRDELKRAAIPLTTKQYINYCQKTDLKLPFLN